jgi:hypothetical protein
MPMIMERLIQETISLSGFSAKIQLVVINTTTLSHTERKTTWLKGGWQLAQEAKHLGPSL